MFLENNNKTKQGGFSLLDIKEYHMSLFKAEAMHENRQTGETVYR